MEARKTDYPEELYVQLPVLPGVPWSWEVLVVLQAVMQVELVCIQKLDLHPLSLLHWIAFSSLCHCCHALNRAPLKYPKYSYIALNDEKKHFVHYLFPDSRRQNHFVAVSGDREEFFITNLTRALLLHLIPSPQHKPEHHSITMLFHCTPSHGWQWISYLSV